MEVEEEAEVGRGTGSRDEDGRCKKAGGIAGKGEVERVEQAE